MLVKWSFTVLMMMMNLSCLDIIRQDKTVQVLQLSGSELVLVVILPQQEQYQHQNGASGHCDCTPQDQFVYTQTFGVTARVPVADEIPDGRSTKEDANPFG